MHLVGFTVEIYYDARPCEVSKILASASKQVAVPV